VAKKKFKKTKNKKNLVHRIWFQLYLDLM